MKNHRHSGCVECKLDMIIWLLTSFGNRAEIVAATTKLKTSGDALRAAVEANLPKKGGN